MATVVQTARNNFTTTSPWNLVWGGNPTTGNMIAVTITLTTNHTVSSVTDTQGNTYTLSKLVATAGSRRTYIYYAKNITGGTTPTVTVTLSGSGTGSLNLIEVSGLSTTAPEEATDSNTGTGTSITSSAGGVNSSANVFAVVAGTTDTAGTFTEGSGYTLFTTGGRRHCQYKTSVAALSGETGPWTTDTSTVWASAIAIYKPDAATVTFFGPIYPDQIERPVGVVAI